MKRFIVNISIIIAIAVCVISLLSWHDANALRRANLKLSENTHILAIGPSTTARALNEDIIDGMFNLSRNAAWISESLPLLQTLLDENPQIDTVWINHGRFNFIHLGQGKDKPSLHLLKDNMQLYFFDKDKTNWDELLNNVDFYAAFLNPDFYNIILANKRNLSDFGFGHTKHNEKNFIDCPEHTGIKEYNSLLEKHGSKIYSKEWILENCAASDKAVKDAIEVCKQKKVVPVLLFTPLYKYDNWYSWDGFCEYIKDYDEDILIADYEDFQFPDDSYRTDIIHLNVDGADFFSSHIKKHGLNAVTLKEWLKQKGH